MMTNGAANCAEAIVVDNDPFMLEMMAELVREQGFTVKAFDTAVAALAWVKLHPPSLAVVDMHMEEMDGSAFLHLIRLFVDLRKVRIVVCTAFPDAAQKLGDLKVDAIVYKPFEIETFERALRTPRSVGVTAGLHKGDLSNLRPPLD